MRWDNITILYETQQQQQQQQQGQQYYSFINQNKSSFYTDWYHYIINDDGIGIEITVKDIKMASESASSNQQQHAHNSIIHFNVRCLSIYNWKVRRNEDTKTEPLFAIAWEEVTKNIFDFLERQCIV